MAAKNLLKEEDTVIHELLHALGEKHPAAR